MNLTMGTLCCLILNVSSIDETESNIQYSLVHCSGGDLFAKKRDFPSLCLPSHFSLPLPFPVLSSSLNPASGNGNAVSSQRVGAEPDRHTLYGAFWTENHAFGHLWWHRINNHPLIFIARQHTAADARYWYSNSVRPSVRLSVCLSVRLSVTRWYCMKTA